MLSQEFQEIGATGDDSGLANRLVRIDVAIVCVP